MQSFSTDCGSEWHRSSPICRRTEQVVPLFRIAVQGQEGGGIEPCPLWGVDGSSKPMELMTDFVRHLPKYPAELGPASLLTVEAKVFWRLCLDALQFYFAQHTQFRTLNRAWHPRIFKQGVLIPIFGITGVIFQKLALKTFLYFSKGTKRLKQKPKTKKTPIPYL